MKFTKWKILQPNLALVVDGGTFIKFLGVTVSKLLKTSERPLSTIFLPRVRQPRVPGVLPLQGIAKTTPIPCQDVASLIGYARQPSSLGSGLTRPCILVISRRAASIFQSRHKSFGLMTL